MSLQDLINVQISATGNLPAQAGFGVPLIAAYHTKYPDLVRYYSDLAGLVADGFSVYSDVYLAASAILDQSPTVTQFGVGRRGSVDTQVLTLTLTSTNALDVYKCTFMDSFGKAYNLSVPSTGVPATDRPTVVSAVTALGIPGMTATGSGVVVTLTMGAGLGAVTYTGTGASGCTFSGTPTADDLILVTMTLGGAVGTATYTWSKNGGSTTAATTAAGPTTLVDGISISFAAGTYVVGDTFTVQASKAGHTTDVQGWDQSQLTTPILQLADTTADPGLAADLAAILAANSDWYGLCLAHNSPTLVKAAMTFVESNKKIGAFNCSDTAIELGTAGNVALA